MSDDKTIDKTKSPKAGLITNTYNVYKDGEKIATGLTDTQYTVANATSVRYYVTAVDGISESAESNAIVYNSGVDGIANIDANANNFTYNSTTQTINSNVAANINVYTTSGTLVKCTTEVSSLNISELANGIYVTTITVNGATTTIKIVK